MKWTGTYVALVTPFRNGQIDESAYRTLIRHCIDSGVEGIVPCGTTGETATMSDDEYHAVISIAVSEAAGAVPVIGGSGTNNTASTVRNTARIRELGCDAALVVTPYYNKPTQAGHEAHYRAVIEAVPDFPVVLYNVPGRTGTNLLPDTVDRLADLPEVVAVKEASGNLEQVQTIVNRCGDRLSVLSGDDALSLPMYAVGAQGVISVAGNVAPGPMSAIWRHCAAGEWDQALTLQQSLFPLFQALFVESNPQPCKAALWMMGMMENELRSPLGPATAATRDRMASVLTRLGIPLTRGGGTA